MRMIALLGLAATTLAGCGGGSGDEGEFTLSNGVLTGIELPSEADLAEFPTEVQTLVNDFQFRNENSDLPSNVPISGTAGYGGVLGFTVESDGEVFAVVTGDLELSADWDNPFGDLVTGTVSNLSGEDAEGEPLTISNTLEIDAPINGSEINGSIEGDLELESEIYNLDGNISGSFAGDGATGLLGETHGTVTNPDASVDEFFGIWFADN